MKQKFRIFNLCYGALCCAVSAAVALIAASILPVKSSHATAVLAILFSFVLSVAAGTIVFAARASRSQAEEEKLFSAIDSIVSGNYEIRLGELSSSYEDAGKAIEKLAETLKNAEKAKADFIGDFSHELKTPIVSIRGFAKILAKGDLTEEEKREYADVIVAESERLIGLTTDTLLINKLDNDAFADANVSFSLSEMYSFPAGRMGTKRDRRRSRFRRILLYRQRTAAVSAFYEPDRKRGKIFPRRRKDRRTHCGRRQKTHRNDRR